MKIFSLTKDDIPKIAILEHQCFGAYAWSENLFFDELNDSTKHYFVAKSEDNLLGYVGFAQVLDEAHIMNIAVDASARRCGIGRALLEELTANAKRLGCCATTLEVRTENAPARALYEGFGFRLAGVRPNYYGKGEDACIYWLRFDE